MSLQGSNKGHGTGVELIPFSKKVKMRRTTTNNKTGDSYALTVPKRIANKYVNCIFTCRESGTTITFESGAKI